ncbi:MAG: ATP-binding protein [Smithellaceae bacterium]|nr:ATP-binding protein [Smithellaceae bacterium]
MEKFTLALVSLVLALSQFLRGKTDSANVPFGLLCLFVFFFRGGSFFSEYFPGDFWHLLTFVGLIGLAPAMISFADTLAQGKIPRHRKIYRLSLLISGILFFIFFNKLRQEDYLFTFLEIYPVLAVIYILVSLIHYLRRRTLGVEKQRIEYLAAALSITITISCLDIFIAPAVKSATDLSFAGLMYFTWLVIAYPQLTKLHELMARAAGVLVMSLLAALAIFTFTGLFSKGGNIVFTHVFISSFIVVISISPFRIMLERIFSHIYPESRDLFTSFYELDKRLERERALLLEKMAPVLAHEIRNPLGSIKGAAQYLKAEAVPEQQRLLQVIIEETDRLNRVVSQFINYAKPYHTTPVEHDIVPILHKAIALIEAHSNIEGITIQKDIHEGLPLVKVDAEQILQVILNIALNGIEAMPGGGVLSFRTSLVKNNQHEMIGLSIRDTGEGISAEDIKNIFNPFFTTKKRGTGLGLSICQQIIRKHGGKIRVKSIPDQGTVFYLWLKVGESSAPWSEP